MAAWARSVSIGTRPMVCLRGAMGGCLSLARRAISRCAKTSIWRAVLTAITCLWSIDVACSTSTRRPWSSRLAASCWPTSAIGPRRRCRGRAVFSACNWRSKARPTPCASNRRRSSARAAGNLDSGQADGEATAFAGGARGLDGAAHGLGELLHQGEAKAGAGVAICAGAEEALENVWQIIGTDALARIADLNPHRRGFCHRDGSHQPARRCVTYRIREQIPQHLLEPLGVDVRGWQLRRNFREDFHAPLTPCKRRIDIDQLPHDRADISGLQ